MTFNIGVSDLKNLISLYITRRDFREEVRVAEQQGGSKYFLHGKRVMI